MTRTQRGMSDKRRTRIKRIILDALHEPNPIGGDLFGDDWSSDERTGIQQILYPEFHNIITAMWVGEVNGSIQDAPYTLTCAICAQISPTISKYRSLCTTCDSKKVTQGLMKRLIKRRLNCHGLHSALLDNGIGAQLTKPQITHFVRLNLDGLVIEEKDKHHLTSFYAITLD